jgi:hypothetical protein
VPGGKKEFCSEPCLTAYRKAQKANSQNNNSTAYSSPNPYSLPLSAASRPSPANSKPAANETEATSSPTKSSSVNSVNGGKNEAATPSSSNSNHNNAAESVSSEHEADHQQSSGNSKKISQPPDQEVNKPDNISSRAVLRIRDPVPFYPLDRGSGSGMNFFRIPVSFLVRFCKKYLKNPCSFIILLIRFASETIRSKKKVGFIFHTSFYVQKDPE